MIIHEKCPTCGKTAKEKIVNTVSLGDTYRKFIWLECGHLLVKIIPKGTPFESMVSNFWKPEVAECSHEWEINQCKKCNEFKLFPYQVEGARFLETAISSGTGGAIFDEMGLGKTVQALAFIKFKVQNEPTLFIVKSKIRLQWAKEILRWLGINHAAQIINSGQDPLIPGLKSYIISFDMLSGKTRRNKKTGKETNSAFPLERLAHIKNVVIDEIQQIKNTDSARTKAVLRACEGKTVIELSATPWKNRGGEFFVALNLLAPRKFPSYQGFLDEWVDFYFDGAYTKQGGLIPSKIPAFKEYVSDIILRREIADVEIEMPEVKRSPQYCELDALAQKSYDSEVSDFVAYYNELQVDGAEDKFESQTNILARMARMRHITGLAKIPATVEFAEEFYEMNDRKLVVFVHHRDVADILYREFREAFGSKVLVLKDDQDNFESKFQNSRRAFLIASTLASGEGLNLQTCGDAILHERQWNPQNEDQAAPGRFRRIGASHKTVNVTFMTAVGTIDEILGEIVEKKRKFFHNAMNKGELPESIERSITKELAEGIVNLANKTKGRLTKLASL